MEARKDDLDFWTSDFWQLSAESYNWLSCDGEAYVVMLSGLNEWHVSLEECVPVCVPLKELIKANAEYLKEKGGYIARYGSPEVGVGQIVWEPKPDEDEYYGFNLEGESGKIFAPIVKFAYIQMERG